MRSLQQQHLGLDGRALRSMGRCGSVVRVVFPELRLWELRSPGERSGSVPWRSRLDVIGAARVRERLFSPLAGRPQLGAGSNEVGEGTTAEVFLSGGVMPILSRGKKGAA